MGRSGRGAVQAGSPHHNLVQPRQRANQRGGFVVRPSWLHISAVLGDLVEARTSLGTAVRIARLSRLGQVARTTIWSSRDKGESAWRVCGAAILAAHLGGALRVCRRPSAPRRSGRGAVQVEARTTIWSSRDKGRISVAGLWCGHLGCTSRRCFVEIPRRRLRHLARDTVRLAPTLPAGLTVARTTIWFSRDKGRISVAGLWCGHLGCTSRRWFVEIPRRRLRHLARDTVRLADCAGWAHGGPHHNLVQPRQRANWRDVAGFFRFFIHHSGRVPAASIGW